MHKLFINGGICLMPKIKGCIKVIRKLSSGQVIEYYENEEIVLKELGVIDEEDPEWVWQQVSERDEQIPDVLDDEKNIDKKMFTVTINREEAKKLKLKSHVIICNNCGGWGYKTSEIKHIEGCR